MKELRFIPRFSALLLWVLISSVPICARTQTVSDSAFMRAQYEMTYQLDTVSFGMERKDLIVLDIGKNVSKCFSYYTYQNDSLLNTPNGMMEWSRLFKTAISKTTGSLPSDFPHKRSTFVIYKDYKRGTVTVTEMISTEGFVYPDSLHPMAWSLSDDPPREMCGYALQKAETDWRGRHWTAWYAPALPVDNGPWKFGGLPGLIFEVYDEGNHYHFLLSGLQNVLSLPITFEDEYGRYGKRSLFKGTDRLTFLRDKRKYLQTSDTETISLLGDTGASGNKPYDFLEKDY